MTIKHKFLFYALAFLGLFLYSLKLFLNSDYAIKERAYFNAYPYVEMALRIQDSKANKTMLLMAEQKNIISEMAGISPEAPPGLSPLSEEYADHFHILTMDKTIEADLHATAIKRSENTEFFDDLTSGFTLISSARAEEEKTKSKNPATDNPATDKNHLASLFAHMGYEAYAAGDYKQAISAFEQAIQYNPHDKGLKIQLAYAHKALGQKKEASRWFRAAIDHFADQAPFSLRREVDMLENRFDVNAYLLRRTADVSNDTLGAAPFNQSQAGLELSALLPGPGWHKNILTTLYGRFLMGLDDQNLIPDRDSLQSGAGLRLRPLKKHNLWFSLERLIAVGDNGRNDWMMRLSYSHDRNSDYQANRQTWFSHNLYLDAAFIRPHNPDIFLTFQGDAAYNIKASEGLVIKPHLMSLATWQKDIYKTTTNLEAGAGIGFKYYFRQTKYRAYRASIDFIGQYRFKLAGNNLSSSGPVFTLLFHF